MSDPTDLDRIVARIRGELRAERERAEPDPIETELRQIRGEPGRASMPRFLLAAVVPVLFLLALALFWHSG